VRGERALRSALAPALATLGLLIAGPAVAAAVEAGHRDFPFTAPSVTKPTGQKPQSKLWFTDAIWWGSLFATTATATRPADEYRIHRFDPGTQAWVDTGTPLDDRNSSEADTLWDGTHLYVASASDETATGIRILRLSYDPASKTWSPDTTTPIPTVTGPVEAVVLDKDSTGRLWITYTLSSTVYVAHTSAAGAWEAPYALPVPNADDLNPDDISALVSYGGRIGVMWSNQTDESFYFASHADGAADSAWTLDPALTGRRFADDHINLKSVQAAGGQVLGVVKTSVGDIPLPGDQVVVLRRDECGAWTRHPFGQVESDHTRPIVVTDQHTRSMYVFATSPTVANGNQSIYYKATSLDAPAFEQGLGIPFMGGQTFDVNDATSTKQDLAGVPFLLVAASDFTNYWHNTLSLDHSGPPVSAPAAKVCGTTTPAPTVTVTPTPTPYVMPTPQPPNLSALQVRPRSFRVAPGRARPGRGLGTRVRFGVSRDARISLRIQRRSKGRYVFVRGSVTRSVRGGLRTIVFAGRPGSRRLRPGVYRFVAVARADGLSSARRRAAFRVLRARTPGT
jgi:hypothetical protein